MEFRDNYLISSERRWNELAMKDALWTVLSHTDKKNGKWKNQEFFLIGQEEIRNLFNHLNELKIKFKSNKALDFGCGVGRLTQALSSYFNETHGVDISPSMIKIARKLDYNKTCFFHAVSDLKPFNDNNFDFIYSNITLQHINPKYTENYLSEFIRLLKPSGLLVFQLPSRPNIKTFKGFIIKIFPKNILQMYYYKIKKIEMQSVSRNKVIEIIEQNKGKILYIENDKNAPGWISYRYYVRKVV